MNVLITSCGSSLGGALAEGLGVPFHLRLTERPGGASHPNVALSPLGHDASTDLLVKGMDAIVHVAEPLPDESPESYLDYTTRLTYNLLWAAHAQGVKRVVLISSLELLATYDDSLQVTERWRPRPTTEMPVMGKYLAEHVAREFAREGKLTVVTLRVGHLVHPRRVPENQVDPLWLRTDDYAAAVRRALLADLPAWSVFHVQSRFPGARYATGDAEKALGLVSTLELPTRV